MRQTIKICWVVQQGVGFINESDHYQTNKILLDNGNMPLLFVNISQAFNARVLELLKDRLHNDLCPQLERTPSLMNFLQDLSGS